MKYINKWDLTMWSTADSIALNTVSCHGFKVLFYLFSFFLAILLRDQPLELWSVVIGKFKLNITLPRILNLIPFLPISFLSFFNHLQFDIFWPLVKLRNGFSDINSFIGPCFFLNNFSKFKSFIFKFFFHNCPRIFIFTELLVKLKQLSDGLPASRFCFLDASFVFFLDSLDNFFEILLGFFLVVINGLLPSLFNFVDQLITLFIDFDVS